MFLAVQLGGRHDVVGGVLQGGPGQPDDGAPWGRAGRGAGAGPAVWPQPHAAHAGAPAVADARTVARNARILAIVQDFDNQQRTPLRYLRALGRLF